MMTNFLFLELTIMRTKLKREIEKLLNRKFEIQKIKWGPRKNHAHVDIIFKNNETCHLNVSCTPSDHRTLNAIISQVRAMMREK